MGHVSLANPSTERLVLMTALRLAIVIDSVNLASALRTRNVCRANNLLVDCRKELGALNERRAATH